MIARTLDNRSLLRSLVLLAAVLAAVIGCRIVTYGIELTGLSVSPGTASLAVGTNQQFSATGTYNDESSKDVTAEAAWSSSDPTVATVSAGVATPLKAGTITVTATLGEKSASSTLTVTNALLQTIEVTPANPHVPNGTTQQLAAIGHFDDSSTQVLTSQATWTSSDVTVTVGDAAGSKGLASSTALGAATSTITATVGAISGNTTLYVDAATLQSVAVTPAAATIKVAQSQQFTATGTFTGPTTHDMTREVAWASSDTGIATIAAGGRATGVFAGATTITATSSALLGSVAGTAQLTVQTGGGGY